MEFSRSYVGCGEQLRSHEEDAHERPLRQRHFALADVRPPHAVHLVCDGPFDVPHSADGGAGQAEAGERLERALDERRVRAEKVHGFALPCGVVDSRIKQVAVLAAPNGARPSFPPVRRRQCKAVNVPKDGLSSENATFCCVLLLFPMGQCVVEF